MQMTELRREGQSNANTGHGVRHLRRDNFNAEGTNLASSCGLCAACSLIRATNCSTINALETVLALFSVEAGIGLHLNSRYCNTFYNWILYRYRVMPKNASILNVFTLWSAPRTILLLTLLVSLVRTLSAIDDASGQPNLKRAANIPVVEMNALFDLYNATNGEGWHWLSDPSAGIPWNFSDPVLNNPCEDKWQGIVCSFTAPEHVLVVNLLDYYLVGTIPYSLGDLTHLEYFDLSNNFLSSTIPETLGALTTLAYLNLDYNQLSGTIPQSLGDLAQLKYLFLVSNELTGTIPASLGHMDQLLYFYLYDNKLTGTIPDVLASLSSLQYLSVNTNYLTGSVPANFGDLSQLLYLDISSNLMNGTIPATLGELSLLQTMVLSLNQISGAIPESLGNLAQLSYLSIYSNRINGTIPGSLGNASQLQYLYLYSNQLTGRIPGSLSKLTHLIFLSLFSNQLSGCIPQMLGNLNKLQYLYIYSNQLTGSIPESLGNLTDLLLFDLDTNYINGTIPETLGALTQLQELYLFSNKLTGSIPCALGNLTQLRVMDIYDNQLSGSMPTTLGNLLQLQDMYLQGNRLNGSIPASIGNLRQLLYLDLNSNELTGSIPPSLGNLLQLQVLYLYVNALTGSIPSSLGMLASLQVLSLYSNQLTGILPATLGNLTQLQIIYLFINRLNGSIPESLCYLPKLQLLSIYSNQLTGTIPESLSHLSQLQLFNCSNNLLHGTIPESLGLLTQLLHLHVDSNYFISSIPESLGNLLQLQSLQLNNNLLTGTIPAVLGDLIQLRALYLNDNQIAGSIPESLSNLALLQYIFLFTNCLTGTIPATLTSLPQLRYLHLHSNQLTGTIPNTLGNALQQILLYSNQLIGIIPSLVNILALQVLLLQNNRLTGNLYYVIDPTTQFQIETVVLNNNQLTGTIPSAIFQLNLQTFVGASNCFEGPLPVEAICSCPNMISFVIDGMSSASSCRNSLFISAYTLEHAIGGTIPTCLFQLPNLTTLHLSGNGFTGSMPSHIVLSDTLTDLSLSHNALTGSIPDQIQLRKWSNIDLSYNRLSGTLESNFSSQNGSVELENNRLSGVIPNTLRMLSSISVLGSNTFSCSYDQSDLPQHDPGKLHYHCGSNSFDILFYVWFSVIISVLLIFGYWEWKYSLCRTMFKEERFRGTSLFTSLLTVLQVTRTCALYIIAVLLPLYCLCSVYYGTQTHKYAYQVSAVFVSGVVPFALDLCFWLILLLVAVIPLLSAPVALHDDIHLSPDAATSSAQVLIFVPYLLLNCFVVVGVNAAYVYVAVYQSNALLLVVQVLLSIFKLAWSRIALPYILVVMTRQKRYGKVQVITQIMVNILNNIVIPCLVVAVVSPNCFYNALVAAPTVSSTTSYTLCQLIDLTTGQCDDYGTRPLLTSFDPPFTYNYQCSSSLITYYAPAFMSMCIVSTVVTPLAQYTCQWLYARATPGTFWYFLLDKCLPRIMKPFQDTVGAGSSGSILRIEGLMTSLVSTLGLLLTFGAVFPPVGFALAVIIFATVLIFRANLSRFVNNANPQQYDYIVEFIRAESNNIDSMRMLRDSVWILVTVSCWFYTLFLFDTLGDAVGFEGAYWVLIVIPLMPLVLYVIYAVAWNYIASQPGGKSTNEVLSKQGEMEVEAVEMHIRSENSGTVHNVLVSDICKEDIQEDRGSRNSILVV